MHRELRSHDFHDHTVDPFQVVDPGHAHENSRGLYAFTALLGLLIGCDLVLAWMGITYRLPFGISLSMIAAILGAISIVHGALAALFQGRIGADFALAQACIAALVLGQPFVAAEVVFIALLGEVLEDLTFSRTKRALSRLVDQTPRTARVRREGVELELPARDVVVGDLLVVGPGERIPVDGLVISGRSTVDQSTLTGEPIPVDKGPGEPVYTGTLNQFGIIEVMAQKVGRDTTFGQVVRMVSEARLRKASLERLADRLARYFLPAVQVAAALTLIAGYVLGWPDVWSRTVAVLVVACPCALVLATPAAMLASMAWLARHGVLIKGGYALERLAACDTFAFDKTGTLTRGKPEFCGLDAAPGWDESAVLRMVASAERSNQHPLALAITKEARSRGLELAETGAVSALPGVGVQAEVKDAEGRFASVLVGNRRLMAERGVILDSTAEEWLRQLDDQGATPLLAAIDGAIVGVIGLRDQVRPEAHDVVHDLKHLKIREIAVLTGDREPAARKVAKKVHAGTVRAELLPSDKAEWVRQAQESGRKVAMVGDGINDAPALAQADVGIAIGGIGADLAAEAGDLILLGEPLHNLPKLVELSRATVRVIRQNIIGFAFGLNAVAVLLASLGILDPVAAAIFHQVGSLLVLLNAMRLLAFGNWAEMTPVRQLREFGRRIDRIDDRLDFDFARRWVWRQRNVMVSMGLMVLLGGYWLSGLTAIGPDEIGLVRRFGGYRAVLDPGLHLRWPMPIERLIRVRPNLTRSLTLGFRGTSEDRREAMRWEAGHGRSVDSGEDGDDEGNGLLMTGDGQYLEITASVHYSIDPDRPGSIRRYALEVAEPDEALFSIAESVVRGVVSSRPLMDLLAAGRASAELVAAERLSRRASALDLGIRVMAVSFQDVHPPLPVVDAYRDVSRAEGDRKRRGIEALAYKSEKVAEAEGKARATLSGAGADRETSLARASGDADSFVYRLEARASAPELTDVRLYWEAIADTLAGRTKVILDDRTGRPQRLVLPSLPFEQAIPIMPTPAVPKNLEINPASSRDLATPPSESH